LGVFFGGRIKKTKKYPQNRCDVALTELRIRNEKPGEKPRKLADGGGLYLLVNTSGKYWRWKYRFQGKEKVMALGVYPDHVGAKHSDKVPD